MLVLRGLLRSSSGPLISDVLVVRFVQWSFSGLLILVTSPVDPVALEVKLVSNV